MKTHLTSFGLSLLLLTGAMGTPDRLVEIVEDFFGSNEMGFAILRTETDNLGSYYSSRVRRYFDEYEKTPREQGRSLAIAKRVRSVLLLDAKYSRGLEPEPSEQILSQDNSIVFADLLKKYPARAVPWTKERQAKLTYGKKEGVYAGRLGIVTHGETISEVFGLEGDDHEAVLDEVMEDMNCIYLRLSTVLEGDEGDRQTRWICNVPAKTEQIKAHLDLEPHCLAAGNHKTREDAVKHAKQVLKAAAANKYPIHELHVWSASISNGERFFTVAIYGMMQGIQSERFERLKKIMGPDIAPTSTESFFEHTWVIPPGP